MNKIVDEGITEEQLRTIIEQIGKHTRLFEYRPDIRDVLLNVLRQLRSEAI